MLPRYGLPHLKFPSGEQRRFIQKALEIGKLDNRSLAKIVGFSPRTVRDWKREIYCMPEKAADIISRKYSIHPSIPKDILIKNWLDKKLIASRTGGIACYKKYGLGTPEGRRMGGITAIAKLRQLGIFGPVKLFNKPRQSKNLAEFIGIMLGDGHVDRLQISITLNSIADANYVHFVTKLCKNLFKRTPRVLKRKKENAKVIYYYGTNLVKNLVDLGLIPGNKVKNQVRVPSWILDSFDYKVACLRGLMDTDGGVFTHRYKVNNKPYAYLNICFTNRSLPLLHFVYQTLEELGFTPKLKDKVENKKVWLYNTHEVTNTLVL